MLVNIKKIIEYIIRVYFKHTFFSADKKYEKCNQELCKKVKCTYKSTKVFEDLIKTTRETILVQCYNNTITLDCIDKSSQAIPKITWFILFPAVYITFRSWINSLACLG